MIEAKKLLPERRFEIECAVYEGKQPLWPDDMFEELIAHAIALEVENDGLIGQVAAVRQIRDKAERYIRNDYGQCRTCFSDIEEEGHARYCLIAMLDDFLANPPEAANRLLAQVQAGEALIAYMGLLMLDGHGYCRVCHWYNKEEHAPDCPVVAYRKATDE